MRGFYLSDDRNYIYVGARGFSRPTDYNNRILLLINGHTVNEQIYGSAPLGSSLGLDMNAIERFEIVRGPGSVLYGTGAMFAVVNIITKSSSELKGMHAGIDVGTKGGKRGMISLGKELPNGLHLVFSGQVTNIDGADLYLPEYDDPETNSGIAENLDWNRSYGFLTQLNWKSLTFQSFLSSRSKGIPTAAYAISFNDDDALTRDTWFGAEGQYETALKPQLGLVMRGYYDSYLYEGVFPYDSPDLNWSESSEEQRIGIETRMQWDPRSYNRIIVGAEHTNHFQANSSYWDTETVYSDDGFPFSVSSWYLQDEHQFTRSLTMTAGLRYSWYSRGFNAIVPRAALVYHPISATTLKLLYGEAFRAPNIYETYYESEDEAKSNPDLKPEHIRTTEFVFEQRLTRALFGAISFYNYEIEDLIDPIIDPQDDLQQFRNLSGAIANGIEIEFTHRPTYGLHGFSSYSYQVAEESDNNNTLTNSPLHIAKLGLSYPFIRYITGAVEMQYESSRYTLMRTKTESVALIHFALSTRRALGPIQASMRVRNVFDEDYGYPGGYEHLEPLSDVNMPIIPQRGRTVSLRLDYRF